MRSLMPQQQGASDPEAGPVPGLGRRLASLFAIKNNRSGRTWSYVDAAAEINRIYRRDQLSTLAAQWRAEGASEDEIAERREHEPLRTVITSQYIGQLVSGEQANPTILRLRRLAEFLDVELDFLLKSEPGVDQQLEDLELLSRPGLRALARQGSELSPRELAQVLRIVETFRVNKDDGP